MASMTLGQVATLRKAIAEGARTDQTNAKDVADRFVELSPGLVSKLGAKRDHLLTGRRGSGKSTHLHFLRQQLATKGTAAPLVDMEVFKDREYPDVLLEILIALLDAIKPTIGWKSLPADLAQLNRVRRLRKKLSAALANPQSMRTSVQDGRRRGRRAGVGLSGGGGRTSNRAQAEMTAENESSRSVTRTAEFEELKIDRMKQLASEISGVLTGLVAHSEDKYALIFLDDFYFVRMSDQAEVLDFLHRVCKGTGVWLKIGGVGSRMRPFKDGDPPIGLQPTQDVDNLPIDVTLSDFASGKHFLERVLDGIIKPLGVSVGELFTDTGRDRMVLACGGAVPRDYITLTEAAVEEAIERLNKSGVFDEAAVIRIRSEDVHRAAGKRISQKETDSIRLDATAEETQSLNARWRDVCEFAKLNGDTAFVLIEQSRLEGEDWGNEILQLENLRLLHRIGESVPNTPSWRGRRAAIYMIDLGQIVVQRMTTAIIPFWENQAEFDKLRRAQWVYEPDWRSRPRLPEQDASSGKTGRSDENALF